MDVVGSPAGERVDRLTRLACTLLRTPVSLLTLVRGQGWVVESHWGLPEPPASEAEGPLSASFYMHAAASGEPLIIEDCREHPLTGEEAIVRDLNAGAYAGVTLRTAGGQVLGLLSVVDTRSRRWTEEDVRILSALAAEAAVEVNGERAPAGGADRGGARGQAGGKGEEFRLLVESVQDYGIFLLDPQGRVTSWNSGAERIKGYTEEEVLGRHFSLFYPPEDVRRRYPEHVLEAAARDGRYESEGWRVRKDGSRFWANVVITAIRDREARLIGFAKVTRDLTERRRVEEEIRRREQRFHSLVAATAKIVWVTDPDGMLMPDRTEWGAFTGQSTDEHRGWGWLDAIHPDDRERTAAAWSAAVAKRTLYEVEHRVRRYDGEYRTFSVRAAPVLEADGRVREWVGAHTDITDQKRARDEREFLGEASRTLAESLDYETTLASIARLAVSRIADWCAVDLLEEGTVQRVAIAHADPEKEDLARELRRYRFDPDAAGGAPEVIRTGEPALYPEISDALLEAVARDPEHRQTLRKLGMRSALVVPLVARGRTIGAISLVCAESGHRYGPHDLEVAEELARRAATAVDHARLFRQTEEAREHLERQAVELEFQMEELQNQAAQLEENQLELEMANEDLQRANAEATAAEAHYRRLVEASPYGVFVLDARGVFTEINPAGGRIVGRSAGEVLGQHFAGLIPPEDLEIATDAFTRVISGRDDTFALDLQIDRPSGERRLVHVVITAIQEDGEITGIHGVSRDITEERRAHDALEESEESYRVLFDSLTELVYVQDLEGRFLNVNEAVLRRYGYSREEILGHTPDLLVDPERTDMAAVQEKLRRACEGEPQQFEFWGRTRGGEAFPKEVTVTRGRYFGQDVVIAVARDVTERRQAEEQRRESQKREQLMREMEVERSRLSGLFEQAPAFIAILRGPEHVFELTNAEYDQMTGHRDLLGKTIREALPELEGQGLLEALDGVYRTGEAYVADGHRVLLQRAEGAELEEGYFNFVYQPMMGPDGAITGVFVHGVEVTDLVRSRQEAEAASQAKSEFLSRMSHELRTPLNAILGFGQLLELEVEKEDDKESLEQILRAGQHLLALIDEVLDIARIEAGQMSLSLEPVSVRSILQESVDLVRVTAAKQEISLRTQAALATGHFVAADQQRLKQVLLNLLSNAIKYNRPEGTVTLSCEVVGEGRLRISVTDTGYGIPAGKVERLFTPFDRLGAEQTGVEGTGLGLALSSGLVEAMGGTLGVESAEGEGSRFWVELSLASKPPAPEPVPEKTEAEIPGEPAGATRTVLFVEDNLANVRLMERVLKRRPQVRLLTAMQGSMGLELAREHRPDLILLDLNLPDLSGDEVLRRLRQDAGLREIPVVMISGDASPAQVRRMLDQGAHHYLTKPFDIQELLRLVDERLQKEEG